MQINFHSPDDVFTDELREYGEEKLTRPLMRHKIPTENARLDVDASNVRERVALRVRMTFPGTTITVSTLSGDAFSAVDMAEDKLARKLRDTEERRREQDRRRLELAPLDDEATDIFTADEEEVLRQMGALDAVLEL
ncbi:MAG: ribosome-associated translation inhibitor RaiA [Deltaproteobacteria bacterium]|jgi:ribosomal subunit interface protein|nr:ribosome-associated translation inhibitor RaiA [Deltaproteobacteria bacterium]MBK9368419.1 ribosome-associated translation inhibitor RaiA [Deltaproteobacteria bacterium]MBK9646200.1 ribosome-associated translation inhibitor RaiA [Deltaproteobacteria bacterium]